MNKRGISVVLAGVGGYGVRYVKALLTEKLSGLPAELVGAVDPAAERSPEYAGLKAAGVPIYSDLASFYAEHRADLAIICTPIHFHKEQVIYCLEHGSQVLCEKPVCALIDDVKEMIAARDRTGLPVSIGYQWSHSRGIQALKRDILQGRFGKPVRMKTIVLWPRDLTYYARGGGWAGRRKDAEGGWILDSVASNATAHYLHNMLFLCGASMAESAGAVSVKAEVYRVNDIEMFDTCALRAVTEGGAELLYLVSHAVSMEENFDPEFVYEFENGAVRLYRDEAGEHMTGCLKNGEVIRYELPDYGVEEKIRWAADVALGKKDVVCGPETASAHLRCVNALAELFPETPVFPQAVTVTETERPMRWVRGLADALRACYEEWALPSEKNESWASPARSMDLTGYDSFSMR